MLGLVLACAAGVVWLPPWRVGGGAAPKLAIASWKLPELELFITAGAYPAPLEKGPRLRGGDCDADAEEGGGAPKASFDGGSSKGEASNIFLSCNSFSHTLQASAEHCFCVCPAMQSLKGLVVCGCMARHRGELRWILST